MRKKLFIFVSVVVLVGVMLLPTLAAQPRIPSAAPTLKIEGTTAYCTVTVTSLGHEINATLSLWRGSTHVASWPGSGTSVVFIDESCRITSGNTYTLKVNYTINGVSYTGPEVSATS